jgi:GT2 family glycosyltransferase
LNTGIPIESLDIELNHRALTRSIMSVARDPDCDNASSDRTPQICCKYERRDSRIRYVRNQRNLGAVANFNRVFELSTAPLFKWSAHDDLYHSTYLDECVRLLEENRDIILAHTGTAFIDEESEPSPSSTRQGAL